MTRSIEIERKLREKRRYYAQNFFEFTRDILGYDLLVTDPHYELADFLTNSPGDGSDQTTNVPGMELNPSRPHKPDIYRRLILVPRGGFKSTIITVSYTIWRLIKNPHLRVLIGSYSMDKARQYLAEIKGHFEDNKELILLFGDHYNKKARGRWTKEELQLYNPSPENKKKAGLVPFKNMHNVKAVGLESFFTGLHPDIGIFDDLVSEKNIATQDQLDKPKRFLKYIEPMIEPGGEINVVGTRYDFRDTYQDLIDGGMFDVHVRAAIGEGGKLWFKEKLTPQHLRAKEIRLGSYIYSCQYMNNPISPDDVIFRDRWVNRCEVDSCPIPIDEMNRQMWVDPAATAGRKSDNSAIIVTGMDRQNNLWVLHTVREKLADEDLVGTMLDVYEQWKPDSLMCEAQTFQGLLEPLVMRAAMDRGQLVNFEPVKQSTRQSKVYRIRSMVPFFQAGKIKILAQHTDLLGEVRRFTGRDTDDDDMLDALATAAAQSFPEKWVEDVTPELIDRLKKNKIYEEDKENFNIPKEDGMTTFNNVFGGLY